MDDRNHQHEHQHQRAEHPAKHGENPNGLPRDDAAAVGALIRAALASGCRLSVHDGEEWTLRSSTDAGALQAALGTTDGDTVRVLDGAGNALGFLELVYGNRDGTTVADHTVGAIVGAIADAASRASETGCRR